MSQTLRGFVGQSMSGQRPNPDSATYQFPAGSYTFTAPRAGYWKFVGWGAGGGGNIASSNDAGASGGYFEITRFLGVNEAAAIVVGAKTNALPGGSTSVTFANGASASATGGGQAAAVGTATGGDLNLSGSAGAAIGTSSSASGLGTGGGAGGGVLNGGGGAPAQLPFRGAAGASSGFLGGNTPGSGCGAGTGGAGGDGMVIVAFIRN